MILKGRNIVVLDLETAQSAEDCRHCGCPHEQHAARSHRPAGESNCLTYSPIGWENKLALGLSIGCYWDYRDSRMHWFDVHTLEATVRDFVETQPLLVSFNGIAFDFSLMRGLLRKLAETLPTIDEGERQHVMSLGPLCDAFKRLCATAYDILAACWAADPAGRKTRGLNSLGAISEANGYGAKEMDGATAPRLWAQGRHAEVLNYCQSDVMKTKALFEQIITTGHILRGDGKLLALPTPAIRASMLAQELPCGCGEGAER